MAMAVMVESSVVTEDMVMEATGMEGMAMAVMVESSVVTEDMVMVANSGATEVMVDTATAVMEATVTDMGSAAATASKATTWAAMAGIGSMAATASTVVTVTMASLEATVTTA